MNFEACSAFTHVTACTLAESPSDPFIEGSSSFVSVTTASIATGWSEPVPGRDLLPAEHQRLARRTRTISLALVRTATPASAEERTGNKKAAGEKGHHAGENLEWLPNGCSQSYWEGLGFLASSSCTLGGNAFIRLT